MKVSFASLTISIIIGRQRDKSHIVSPIFVCAHDDSSHTHISNPDSPKSLLDGRAPGKLDWWPKAAKWVNGDMAKW
jgi:hypothetical protein